VTEAAVKVNLATKQCIEFLSKVFDVSQAEIVSLAVKEYVSEEMPESDEFMHLRNLPLTRYEKKILRRYLCDIELHQKIIGESDLPLVKQLRIAGDQVKLVLESGSWLLEVSHDY
jgi:hypothetical protein